MSERFLAALKEKLDDIKKVDESSYKFVESLLIRQEEGTLGKLSDKQFMWLFDLHERYCVEPSARERLRQAGLFRRQS